MRKWNNVLALIAGFGLAASSAWALDLGDAAPALKVKEWVQGTPVELEKGKEKNVYVVEFWATWCAPCRKSIPHLNSISKKYADKGLVIVGVTNEDDEIPKVKSFVKEQGDGMSYTIAVDDARQTTAAYMEATGMNGIPCAYVVDKSGKLMWYGNPLAHTESFDAAIEAMVAGKFDLAAAKAAKAKIDEIEKEERAKAERMMEMRKPAIEYFQAVSSADGANAKELGQKAYEALANEAEGLNWFAWIILDNKRIVTRDIPLALKAAERANELSKGESWVILDTYARALFDSGRAKDAVAAQEKALKLCDDAAAKKEVQAALEKYQAAAK